MPNPLTDDTYGPNGPMNQDLAERTARAQALSDLVNSGLMQPVPNVLMQPDLLEAGLGLQPKAGTWVDELGRVYDKATNQPIQETRRPNVLPVTRTPEGNLEFAMPRALDIIGNVAGGAIAPVKAAKGEATMGSGPIRKLTPVDHNPFADDPARMLRAQEQGFDINNPVYHGTNQDFKSFNLKNLGKNTSSDSSKLGIYFTESPKEAGDYANMAARHMFTDEKQFEKTVNNLQSQIEKAERSRNFDLSEKLTLDLENLYSGAMQDDTGQQIVKTFLKKGKVFEIDATGKNLADVTPMIEKAKAEGYDSVNLKNMFDPISTHSGNEPTNQWVIFNPKNIRSVNAQFDPAKKDSGMLLAADAPVGLVAAGVRDAYKRTLSPLGLYSHGAEAASNLSQAKGSPEQFKAMLQKAGVKPVEFENAGFDSAFAGKSSVTKDDVAKLFADKMPVLEEKVLGFDPKAKLVSTNIDDPRWREMDDFFTRVDPNSSNPPKFQQYTLPGSENYREVLLKAPDTHTKMITDVERQFEEVKTELSILRRNGKDNTQEYEQYSKMYEDLYKKRKELDNKKSNNYLSSHWDDPNVVAHVRMADRNVNGEKTLHIEELQSDWAQEGRKKGFETSETAANREKLKIENEQLSSDLRDIKKQYEDIQPKSAGFGEPREAPENYTPELAMQLRNQMNAIKNKIKENVIDIDKRGLPSGPYVGNTQQWTDLALKRALKEAADGNYDRMIWTPGAEQAKRYDLSKQVKRVYLENPVWHGENDIRGNIAASDLGGNDIINKPFKNRSELEDLIGKEAAKNLIDNPSRMEGRSHVLEGQDLSVGGEGMKSYYDKIVPTRLKEIVKRIDPEAKIEMVPVDTRSATDKKMNLPAGQSMNTVYTPSIKMTPKLKEAIKKGLPAFSIGGAAALGVANSPNMRYNLKPVDHNPFEPQL